MTESIRVGLKRFGKGALAGGIAQVLVVIGTGLHFSSVAELKNVVLILATAFVTGVLLGLEKALSYNP